MWMVHTCTIPDTSPLFCYNVGHTVRGTHQMWCRGEMLRDETWACMWMSFTHRVGPAGNPLLNTITDGGKINEANNMEYMSVLPHINPLLCSIFAKGAMLLWRLLFMAEKFPDPMQVETWYNRFVLREASSHMRRQSYRSQYETLIRLYNGCEVLAHKITHQGRVDCQRNLEDAGHSYTLSLVHPPTH